MRAFLLSAGRGLRFRPVTERIPKPLFPFLNVPLIRWHLKCLRRQGVLEAGVNLHHLGHKIQSHLGDRAPDLPDLRFFPELQILGTAGALNNAASWLEGGDFLVVNADAAIDPDIRALLTRHRETKRAVTLYVVENREPDRYTPLEAQGDRITGFGGYGPRPLLYTGVCVMSPRLLPQIPPGEASLVSDLWEPLLAERREEIGWILHEGPFSDLGRPSDFLRASLEALERGGPFPDGSGLFDPHARVLSPLPADRFEAVLSVLGKCSVGSGARIRESVVWGGAEVGRGTEIDRCLVAGGRVPALARYRDALLWPGPDGEAVPYPLS